MSEAVEVKLQVMIKAFLKLQIIRPLPGEDETSEARSMKRQFLEAKWGVEELVKTQGTEEQKREFSEMVKEQAEWERAT